jgi:spore coat polysaccharide biosynthesis protein SpsF
LRLTLDTDSDLAVIREVFEALYPVNPAFGCADVIRFLDARPEVSGQNSHVVNKTAR